eukprot:TRINITY_DN257_c0_g3_i2.p1 TRINITY_DN257_c0_g3~~TRINITY_DN257_c0_g3_i2.p1  ORF type:complete len:331 (-),score=44.25 TRINITY_DN257_c0_g3_i2:76-1068(-)
MFECRAFFLQKLLLWGLPISIGRVIQHVVQFSMFLGVFIAIFRNDWFVTQNLSLGMTACTLFFKMHSYTSVNIALREEYLSSKKNKGGIYPSNITLWDFVRFMFLPTFVYRPKFELSSRLRIFYLVIKFFMFMFLFISSYQVVNKSIIGHAMQYGRGEITFFQMYLMNVIPTIIAILMLIMVIFDSFCTFVAETTGYPDRQFYEDFWNATTMNEFLSKMNTLIPNFLRYHVMCPLIADYHVSPKWAQTISFTFAAALLEMLMIFIFKSKFPYLFIIILANCPIYTHITWFRVSLLSLVGSLHRQLPVPNVVQCVYAFGDIFLHSGVYAAE